MTSGSPVLREADDLPDGLASNMKSTVFFSLGPSVMLVVCSPKVSCHATSVYSPGGKPSIQKDPSLVLTAKKGCAITPRYALIHGCWLHFTGMSISGRLNAFSRGPAFGACIWFH